MKYISIKSLKTSFFNIIEGEKYAYAKYILWSYKILDLDLTFFKTYNTNLHRKQNFLSKIKKRLNIHL